MKEDIAIAGAGGQGVLVMGKLLVHAAFLKGFYVSMVQQYSPYVRGGWVSCNLVVSDQPIDSPVNDEFDTVVVFDPVSYQAFTPKLKSGGYVFWNQSLIHEGDVRQAGQSVGVPVNAIATELGNLKLMNMVMLGSYCRHRGWLTTDDVIACLKKTLPERRHKLIPLNEQALKRGESLNSIAKKGS